MKKTKKALASLAIAGMVLSMAPASVFAADSNRISGAGRVETAIAIANDGWTTSDSVIVVPADDANIVDALAAAPLAGQLNAPILVTYKDALDAKVKEEIMALKATKVYAIGALSDAVVNELKALSGVTVTPLKGADRVNTAALVAGQLTGVKGSFVVAYNGSADALSAASYAAANDYSIVIANPDGSVPAGTTLGSKVYTVGGQVTVPGATALKGSDRYATNNAVVDGLEYGYDKVYVANGQTLVDALAGAPLAAKTDSPIVLADSVGVATGANDNLTYSSKVIALGGTGAVSDAVLAKVSYQAPAQLEVESVTALNAKEIKVQFNTGVDEDSAEDSDNYTFTEVGTSNDLVIDEVELDANGTSVTITLDDNYYLTDDETDYNVVISDDIKGLAKDYKAIVSLYDDVRPMVKAVDLLNRDRLQITFTEDVDISEGPLTANDIEVLDEEDEALSGLEIEATDDGNVYEIFGLASADEGEYTLAIDGGAVLDLAGNKLSPSAFEQAFTLEEDNTKPTVKSLTSLSKVALKVVFSEPVDPETVTLTVDGVDYDAEDLDSDDITGNTEFIFTVDEQSGKTKVTIAEDYEDFAGNVQTKSYTKYINFTDAGPKLESTKGSIRTIQDTKYAVFTFDQDITLATTPSALTASYLDEDDAKFGTKVSGGDIYSSEDMSQLKDDQIAIDLSDLDEGDYTVEFYEGLVEAYGASNDKVSVTFSVSESEEGDVEVVSFLNDYNHLDSPSDISNYYVTFSDTVGNSAIDPANYTLDGDRVFEKAVFVADKDLEEGTAKKSVVKLTLKSGSIKYTNDYEFEIDDILDDNGSKVDTDIPVVYQSVRIIEVVKPYVTKVVLVDTDVIEVTFSEAITGGTVTADDFDVTEDGVSVDIASIKASDDKKTFALVLDDDVDPDKTIKAGTSKDFDGKDGSGNKGTTESMKTAVDGNGTVTLP